MENLPSLDVVIYTKYMEFIPSQMISCHIVMAEQSFLPQRMQNFSCLYVFMEEMSIAFMAFSKSLSLSKILSLLLYPWQVEFLLEIP